MKIENGEIKCWIDGAPANSGIHKKHRESIAENSEEEKGTFLKRKFQENEKNK